MRPIATRIGCSTTSKVGWLDVELENLQTLAAKLPSHLHKKLAGFADEVRGQYRMLINGTWATTIMAVLLFAVFMHLFYRWIFPAAADSRGRIAARGRRRFRLSHPSGHQRRNGRTGRGHERHDRPIPGHPRRSRPPGARADQAGGASGANGQRGLSGRRRGPRNQQSAGLDRHVRRIAGKPDCATH